MGEAAPDDHLIRPSTSEHRSRTSHDLVDDCVKTIHEPLSGMGMRAFPLPISDTVDN